MEKYKTRRPSGTPGRERTFERELWGAGQAAGRTSGRLVSSRLLRSRTPLRIAVMRASSFSVSGPCAMVVPRSAYLKHWTVQLQAPPFEFAEMILKRWGAPPSNLAPDYCCLNTPAPRSAPDPIAGPMPPPSAPPLQLPGAPLPSPVPVPRGSAARTAQSGAQ